MNQRINTKIRKYLPPFLVKIIRNIIKSKIRYLGDYSTWEEAIKASKGYNQPSILEKTKIATLKVMQGEAVYERDSVLFDHIEYSLPVLAGLMLTAAKNEGQLSVLDFGGSLGSSFFQNRNFLNELPDVKWGIVEQPHYVKCGGEFIKDEKLRFYNTIEDCVTELKPNVVLLGSVLQYLSNPYQMLDQLSQIDAKFLVIDRTPFSKLYTDIISIQQVPSTIYKASYPLWIFSRKRFDEKIEQKWQLIEEFDGQWGTNVTSKGIKFSYQAMIFRL